jgi:hypothetical protein
MDLRHRRVGFGRYDARDGLVTAADLAHLPFLSRCWRDARKIDDHRSRADQEERLGTQPRYSETKDQAENAVPSEDR